MEKRTEGAWLIHHTTKLQQVTNTGDFEEIELAGKCGLMLSGLAASHEESSLSGDKVKAIAQSVGVKRTELATIIGKLEEEQLINKTSSGDVAVLGVTTSSTLTHTVDIYKNLEPSNFQDAILDLSEKVSEAPQRQNFLKEFIGDSYKLSTSETTDLFTHAEEIGFVDFEELDSSKEKMYFNGNLFRRNDLSKANAVLSSLKTDEIRKIHELDELIKRSGCVTSEKAISITGNELMQKLQSIGMYDFNEVSNDQENKIFVTKPAAFSKFGNPFEEDALDLAKAFVASLSYGMNFSPSNRGRINNLKALMRALVNGYEIGPATAIGQDYRILELKRVISLRHDRGGRYYMKLLKRDIGEIAMQVLEHGDATEPTILGTLSSSNLTLYKGPEINRRITRKKQNSQSKKELVDLLRTFRS